MKDMLFALRQLMKNPGFTAITVITLALGIGANTAIFTVVDAALLRPLPYRQPDRLTHLWERNPLSQSSQRQFSYPDYLDINRNNTAFEETCAYAGRNLTLISDNVSERLQAVRITASFFITLGIEPALGRSISPEEENSGAVVMLSHRLWQRSFGGDPSIIGQTILLNENRYAVIGVLPAHFYFAPVGEADLWLPLAPSTNEMTRRELHWLGLMARLRPDVTIEQAAAGMQAVAQQLQSAAPQSHAGTEISIVSPRDQAVGQVRPLLLVLFGAVAFVLLIACANVANLMLVRSTARRREMAIRLALGASRLRIISQSLSESIMLSIAGGLVGLLIAQWGVELIIAAIPGSRLPYLQGLSINAGVLCFAFALSLVTGILFGLAPAIQSSKVDVNESLKDGGRTVSGSSRLRKSLVVTEIALAMVLLTGAGLMMKSLLRLLDVDPGFETKNLHTFQLALP
ncbi:MAG TPA: ABC transporter permease, partial [Blastocatellia bacterium]